MRTDAGPCYGPNCDHVSHGPNSFQRLNEEMLLGRARELLAQPAPDYDNLWLTALRVGELRHYVTELAAALELRREAELPARASARASAKAKI